MISLPKILFLLAAFAANDTPEEPVQTLTKSDYTSLLTDTDEIKRCVQIVREKRDRTCDEPFYELVEQGCACLRDTSLTFMRQAGITDPVIQNAIVQTTLNPDLLRAVYNESPTGMSFGTYLVFHMEDEIGVSEADMLAAVEAAGSEASKLETLSEAERYAFAMSIPSCKASLDLTVQHIPDWDHHTNTDDDLKEHFCAPQERVCKLPKLPFEFPKRQNASRLRGTTSL